MGCASDVGMDFAGGVGEWGEEAPGEHQQSPGFMHSGVDCRFEGWVFLGS